MQKLKITAAIASIFSVLFSLSIIYQLSIIFEQVALLAGLSVFLVFALVTNERYKVRNLSKKFDKEKYSIGTLWFTLGFSLTMSLLGTYFWTNKTNQQEMADSKTKANQEMSIEAKYKSMIDSVSNLDINRESIAQKTNDIKFWRNRSCANNDQRQMARENIIKLENELKQIRDDRKIQIQAKIIDIQGLKNKELAVINVDSENNAKMRNLNNIIFWIFFCLVAITEGMIVYIQYDIANFYTDDQKLKLKILRDLLAKNHDHITTNLIKYHRCIQYMQDEDAQFEFAEPFLFLLGDLGIIENPQKYNSERNKSSKSKKGKFIDRDNAYQTLIKYFTDTNSSL